MGRSPGMPIPRRVKSVEVKRHTNPMSGGRPLKVKVTYEERRTNPM